MLRKCNYCKSEYTANPSYLKRGQGNFCSRSCSSKFNGRNLKKKPDTVCSLPTCDKMFYRSNSKRKNSKSGLMFCCREHKDLGQRLENGLTQIHPDHYGTVSTQYRDIAFRSLPHSCNRCCFDDERILVVHHIDRNHDNNNLSNLEILCHNCHAIDHFENRDGMYAFRSDYSSSSSEC